jgi:hypothetical protein
LSASEAGLRAQYQPVAPGENSATPATLAGEIELARSPKAAHLEPEVQVRAEHDFQKLQDDRLAERNFGVAPGPESRKNGRSDYRWQNTTFQTTTGFKFFRYFRLQGIGRFLIYNLGSGTDHEYADADRFYVEAAPGILTNSNLFQDGGSLHFDYRDNSGDPHFGGNYLAEFSTFNDVRHELVPVFCSIAVLDLKIVKWAKKV